MATKDVVYASDYRSLPDHVMNMLLYPIAAWGVALGGLFFFDYAAVAIMLCYPLALWQSALVLYWGVTTIRRVRDGEITRAEADAGVRSVGHILAASALLPGIVFMAADPMNHSAWGAFAGVFTTAAIVYVVSSLSIRISFRITRIVALGLGCLALPLNATGAVSVAAAIGWYDIVFPGLGDYFSGWL